MVKKTRQSRLHGLNPVASPRVRFLGQPALQCCSRPLHKECLLACEAETSSLVMEIFSQGMTHLSGTCGPKPLRPCTSGPEDLSCLSRVNILGAGFRRYSYREERGCGAKHLWHMCYHRLRRGRPDTQTLPKPKLTSKKFMFQGSRCDAGDLTGGESPCTMKSKHCTAACCDLNLLTFYQNLPLESFRKANVHAQMFLRDLEVHTLVSLTHSYMLKHWMTSHICCASIPLKGA